MRSASPQSALSAVLSSALTLAAVAIAATVVKREFFPSASPRVHLVENEQSLLPSPEWDELLSAAIWDEDTPTGTALLIELVDIECPFCQRFHVGPLRDIRQEFAGNLRVAYVHWPLGFHRFALPGAEAAECAGQQGRFGAFLDTVFARQDSLGLKAWSVYATEAAVADLEAFNDCLAQPDGIRARIEAGVRLAGSAGYSGTPTILLNGWRFVQPPSADQLRAAVTAVLEGREPTL